jgi:hypothetical protein|tara:strand:- start:411 stop:821 length:411 start_codon:yes stop_codon:yes gene_type:complete
MALDLFKRPFIVDDDTGTQISDWKALIQNGTFIHQFDNGEDEEKTLYTVPSGKKLYIYGLFIGAQNNDTISNIPTCDFMINDVAILSANTGKLTGGHEYNTLGLGTPILVDAGGTIKIDGNRENTYFRGAFVGYLI